MDKISRLPFVLVIICLAAGTASAGHPTPHAIAAAAPPSTWDILADNFESGALGAWQTSSPAEPQLSPGHGRGGSTGLAVALTSGSSYIYQTDLAKAEEAYLSFWFNPNYASIPDIGSYWIPGESISVAEVVNSDDWWPPLVALYVRHPAGQSYQAYLAWSVDGSDQRYFDYENAFALSGGWQQITIGYRIDEWVAAWLNGELVRYATNVEHGDPYGDIAFFGNIRDPDNNPSGTILLDEVAFQVPRLAELWVDAANGDDHNSGTSAGAALRSIQRAADLAGPGTAVHILPGVYRETVKPALNGSASEPVRYMAEAGAGTAILRGSEHGASLTWTALAANTIGLPPGVNPQNIYAADLSAWNLDHAPRFVVELDGNGEVQARLPLAREPDWSVATEWKHHEFWWAADGGSSPAACDPASNSDPNCDGPSRSMTQLTDRTNDAEPAGVEAGNLTTLGDLTGAALVAIDTLQGHYVYRRSIVAHDIPAGRVTVDRICEHDGGSGNPGLGWGSKYYVEDKPNLLDTPGEWWYDPAGKHIYLYPRAPGNPASQNIEISQRDNGFNLRNRSYTVLDGLAIELFNDSAVFQGNWETHKSYGNTLNNLRLRYANWGVYIEQSVVADSPPGNVIDGFTLEGSEIAYMDSLAIRLIDWWEDGANPDRFSRSGVRNTTIRNNELHHLGFRTDGDNAIGASFSFANRLRFEGNHVHHVAHNGVQFSQSVIQSEKEYGFSPGEIKTGDILVKDNIFEKACQLTTDCGGLKIWGSPPDNHVFRNFLVTGNVFRDTYGWTYVSEKRGRWMGGDSSAVRGLGGFGLYVDHASGIHAYRNIAYNNAYTGYMVYGRWRDGEIVYVNNVAANSLYGMSFGGGQYDTHGAVDTQVLNNILVGNEGFGLTLSYAQDRTANTTIDHNLYFNNGWRPYSQGGMWQAGAMLVRNGDSYDPYPALTEAQASTPWEDHGAEGDPALWDYDPDEHNLHDGSWADFHLTSSSAAAIDLGTAALPASLAALLEANAVQDYRAGGAYDAGRYEAGYLLLASPESQPIDSGGAAAYALSLFPSDLPYPVSLTADSPTPGLELYFSTATVSGMGNADLTVSHVDSGAAPPGRWYTIPVSSSGGGFAAAIDLQLLIDGTRLHLPLISR
jgi:hypothetical protein